MRKVMLTDEYNAIRRGVFLRAFEKLERRDQELVAQEGEKVGKMLSRCGVAGKLEIIGSLGMLMVTRPELFPELVQPKIKEETKRCPS